MSDFGIFAQDLKVKVTNEPKSAGKLVIIPCAMGFKNQDKWINEWVDVVVFPQQVELQEIARMAARGMRITVNGRMNLNSYNDKKTWQIYADRIDGIGQDGPTGKATDDIPF